MSRKAMPGFILQPLNEALAAPGANSLPLADLLNPTLEDIWNDRSPGKALDMLDGFYDAVKRYRQYFEMALQALDIIENRLGNGTFERDIEKRRKDYQQEIKEVDQVLGALAAWSLYTSILE